MILEEFDPSARAVINPSEMIRPVDGMPRVAVACYSWVTFERILMELKAEEIITFSRTANGATPIYRVAVHDAEVALFMIDVGAPASVGMLEEVFQMGVQKAVIFGTCGVLDSSISDCSIIVPDRAVRDEGTSYHYVPAADEIAVNEKYMEVFVRLLDELRVKYTIGKTWTTDAFYRETPDKVKRRKQRGCICVDMECSANAAAAAFRGKDLIQFFYAADNLDAEQWEARSLGNGARLEEKDRIAAIALELAVRILDL
ncbi:MAG: nucleoside phosphorylase [Lachnospiraceae bacterium]|nr:nucleoside phosphorylase [Lachnospiraceae bacterium]